MFIAQTPHKAFVVLEKKAWNEWKSMKIPDCNFQSIIFPLFSILLLAQDKLGKPANRA